MKNLIYPNWKKQIIIIVKDKTNIAYPLKSLEGKIIYTEWLQRKFN